MVENSLAPSWFLLPSPGDVPPHKPRPLNGSIPQSGAFSRSRAGPAEGEGSCSFLIQPQVMATQSLEEYQMVKTSKGRNYEHSQKIQMMLCLAKLRSWNQLPEVGEITGPGIQSKHLVRNEGSASWGGAKALAAQLNRYLLVLDTKCLEMSFQNPP